MTYCFEHDINNIVHVVYGGNCIGVCLSKRASDDNHLIWTFLGEDDEN